MSVLLFVTLVLLAVDAESPAPASAPVGETVGQSGAAPDPGDELDELLRRALRLRDHAGDGASGRDLLAEGALAAAETRAFTLGRDAATARLHDVVERFPGTPAAREARALLAAPDGDGR